MTPISLYTAIRAEERRTGERVLPEWLQPEAKPSGYWWDTRFYPKGNKMSTHVPIHPDAAATIILGSMAAWCSGRGIAVVYDTDDTWVQMTTDGVELYSNELTATSALSAFGEATLAALRAMDAKGGEA